MTLGEKIASARKEKGMTQEMLAEQLGVTRQAVARWETGKALPGTANLFMLRQLLGIPLEAADMEATDLEGTTGTEKSGTLANTEKAEKTGYGIVRHLIFYGNRMPFALFGGGRNECI